CSMSSTRVSARWAFFFSSRRRHTSCYRDWSSDVCSSDLAAPLAAAARQLAEYFAGQRTEFDLPLEMAGTDFQRRVWAALREIPRSEERRVGKEWRCGWWGCR